MDGIHDLGGRQGFGPVIIEPNEPVFHERWEAVARALVFAVFEQLPHPSSAVLRHAIERMDPAQYLSSPYYEHWLTAAATMAAEGGLISHDELEARVDGSFPISRPVRSDPIDDLTPGLERFAVGDRVRVRNRHPVGHTRAPGYLRGHLGVVSRVDGSFNIPDIEAHTLELVTEATYSIRFEADELWGDGQPGVSVNVDLWDSYLEVP